MGGQARPRTSKMNGVCSADCVPWERDKPAHLCRRERAKRSGLRLGASGGERPFGAWRVMRSDECDAWSCERDCRAKRMHHAYQGPNALCGPSLSTCAEL